MTGYVRSVRDDLTAFVTREREEAIAAVPAHLHVGEDSAAAGGKGIGGNGDRGEGTATMGVGAIGRTLAVLGRLGEDLGRMIRLRGRVEHQVRLSSWLSAGAVARRTIPSRPSLPPSLPSTLSPPR